MKLNPQQAPLYGGCVLTVQLDDEDGRPAEEEEEELEVYLLFSGSTQKHLTSTLKLSQVTLQAVCPAHNVCEQVLVTLCLARPDGPVDPQSQETFCFVQDLALDMAHFLLDTTAPQEALLLDDEQIPLKECEKLDQNLALALRHLTLTQQRTGPGVDGQRADTVTHQETCLDVSTLLDSNSAESQCQQLSSLLHLAAGHGLRRVAAFLLQQPGAEEALRRTNAQGLTAGGLAERGGHHQLLELFTQYETSSNVQVEPKEQPHFYPEGRVFEHHATLGTYTLTFPGVHQRETGTETGTDTPSRDDCCLQEEVKELRRQIHLHRDRKRNSDPPDPITTTHDLQPCSNGLSVVTIETCSTTTEERGSPPSRGEDAAAVTHTSCPSGSLSQRQEAEGEQRGTPAANSPAGRNRKHRKRTTKTTRRATESTGNNRNVFEVGRGNARRSAKTTGSRSETDGATSPREPESVTGDQGASKSPRTEDTALPIRPSAPGADGKCDGRKAAASPATTSVEKQEGEKWEVDLLICERVTETEAESVANAALGSAAGTTTVTMGQEQSQDPQESQSDPEEPSQPDTMNNSPRSGPKSPHSERKPRRGMWRDGTGAKTVWYQGEDVDQDASEGREEAISQTVWYDGDTEDQRKHEQLEQSDLSSEQASGLPQLLEQTFSSHQLSAALSQPHAAGAQPAPSHGPGAQRREVHGSQREEEVGPDWKEGDREEVSNRETTSSRKSSETADVDEGREKQASGETGAKGRKKRRKKRGKRENKLSSSSSIESQSQIDVKTQETNLNAQSEAKDSTGRTDDAMLLPSQTEPAHGPECNVTNSDPSDTTPEFSPTDNGRADLTEDPASLETKESSEDGPDNTESELTHTRETNKEEITTVHPIKKEILVPTELDVKIPVGPVQQTQDNVSENEDLMVASEAGTSRDLTSLVGSNCLKELPVKHPDPTEDSFLTEFPEQKKQHVGSVESDKPVEKEILVPTELDLKGLTGPVQQTQDNMSEIEDLMVAGEAGTSGDLTGSMESNCPKELPVKHSDATEDSFLTEFPEQKTQRVRSVESDKLVEKKLDLTSVASSVQQTDDNVESRLEIEDLTGVTAVDLTESMGSNCPKELPVKHSDATEDLFLTEFPEQKRQHVRSVESDKPEQPADPTGRPVGVVESEAGGLPDVLPLQMQEGSAETTAGEYLEHCLASEMLRDQEGRREELWEAEEEVSEERSDSRVVDGKEQNYNEGLVATAVAVVTVAIASAVASIELSQLVADDQSEREEASKQLPDDLLNTVQSKDDCQEVHPHVEPLKDPSNVEISQEADPVQSNTETVKLATSQQANLDLSALVDAPSSPQLHTEERQTESTCSLTEEVHLKALSEANEMIPAEIEGQRVAETQIPCPVTEPEPHPDTICPGSDENPILGKPQDQFVSQEEHRIEDDGAGSDPVGGEVGPLSSERQEQSCEEAFRGRQTDPQQDEQVKTPPEGEIPALTLTGSSELPVASSDSTPVADPGPEEPTTPLNDEPGHNQLLPLGEAVIMDKQVAVFNEDALDTVDGWKEREKMKTKREEEEEERKTMVTADVTSKTAAAEDHLQTRRHSDTLLIQRETDVFCSEPNTASTCSDVRPHRDECVSVCLMHKDGVKVSTPQDDGVFKKPKDPPPCVGLRDKGVHVSCSSADDAPTDGALSTAERAHSAGSSDAVSPRSSRLSWKSETEDRGGGPTGGGGEEEEIKDQLSENPVSSAILRASIRSLSPFRRHSWEPGQNSAAADMDVTQRSSLRSLSGEMDRVKPPLHRRSMSWCPSNLRRPDQEQIDSRSYSLEGLVVERGAVQTPCPSLSYQEDRTVGRGLRLDSQERGSLVSLTEEEQEGDGSSIDSQTSHHQVLSVTNSCPSTFHHQTLTKSISMVTINHRDIDVSGFPRSKRRIRFSLSISPLLPKNRRFFSIGSSSSDEEEEEEEEKEGGRISSFPGNSASLEYSISEEEPGPLRSDTEGKGGPKISRTFSYLRSKMTKKGKEKEKERKGERERENKEREKKSVNGHLFIPISPSPSSSCQHCCKLLHNKETFICNNCGAHVHKCCRENLSVCTKNKTKQQLMVPDAVPGSAVNMRSKSTSSASSVSSTSSSSSRERWSTATSPEDPVVVIFPRRHPSIFNQHSNLAKSISTSNIAGLDDVSLKGLKFLSQSTDSLHKGSKVNASTESLTDEGTEMMDSQLMGEFECDIKDLEADSWSGTVDKKFLKTLKKDEIKKQDVIYELYQTEFHHVRTLKIMSEVYYKGLQKELQLDTHSLDKIFPVLDELLDTHTHFLTLLMDRKRASSSSSSSSEAENHSSFLICSIGDVLLSQFSGSSADRMKKVYGKFCSRHNEAVNLYKDLYAKDKRFQAFIKRTMSSSIVRRLSIPECILLVTQRITKYPVLIQRILQHTKDSDEDHSCVCDALRCVKELIAAVDSKVNEQEKKHRLREVYSRTDSKSIMRMKSGQMFAKEDLIRGRKLLHDGALQLKNSAGRLKDVQAMLLSDVLVFLQEKDQKYVFASLDQRSTVISLQNLIVREVANEERGLFLITAGIERPEMVEVLVSSKEERNTWRAIIQDAMHCMEKDEDEGVPSETEEDRRQQENRVKEIRELLRRKDEQIISLLEEKVHIFRELGDCNPASDDTNPPIRERMLFMGTSDDVTKGEPIIKDAMREVETLHALVHSGVGGAGCSVPVGLTGGSVGPVCLPRRAETFGGFDSHQMSSSKNGEKEEGDESLDLRRTESDSVLKKGATASLQMLLKRNNEQVQHSVTHLHELLISLQAVVVQQDSFIEDQRQTLNERLNSSRHSSSSSLSSSSSSRPSSLIEQEKHRSLERQRQEAATLQKQQAAHQEERRRREKAWEVKERSLAEREEMLKVEEEQTRRRRREVMEEGELLQRKKEEYQGELERLREAQRRLERDKEALRRDTERLEAMKRDQSEQLQRFQRTPSTTSEDSIRFHSSSSLDLDPKEAAEPPKAVELSSSAPTKEPFLRIGSKRMGKNFNPFSSSSKSQGAEKESQLPSRLLQLAKPKEKKDKRKKKSKGEQTESKVGVMADPQNDGDIFFC